MALTTKEAVGVWLQDPDKCAKISSAKQLLSLLMPFND